MDPPRCTQYVSGPIPAFKEFFSFEKGKLLKYVSMVTVLKAAQHTYSLVYVSCLQQNSVALK